MNGYDGNRLSLSNNDGLIHLHESIDWLIIEVKCWEVTKKSHMASHKMLQQAIELMQAGKTEAGARMLQVVIKDQDLSHQFRATAYAWLAESQDDLNFKINCLNRALDSDPTNQQIQDRLNGLLAVQPPKPNQVVQRPPAPQNPVTNMGGFDLPNAVLPDSQPIDVIKPSMSDSQPMQPVNFNPPSDPWQMPPHNTGNPPTPPNDPRQSTGQYPQTQPPNAGRATGSYPITNMPNNLSDSQPSYPSSLPNQPGMPPTQQQARHRLQQTPRVVGIQQGPNGTGSGVFVTTDGIVATTRYVVGGSEELVITLDTGQEMPAQVVRTYPEFDLALIQVNVVMDRAWPPSQVPAVPDNEAFTIMSFNGTSLRGYKRKSKNQIANHWIQTSIDSTQVPDAGGTAIFDSNNYLLGILTRNNSRETGLTYGLHISHIIACVNQYIHDRQQNPNAGYCVSCGNMTHAQDYGGYYCETCGTVLPGFEDIKRQQVSTPQLLHVYGENLHRACPNCSAKAGFYNGKCLRCGYDIDTQ